MTDDGLLAWTSLRGSLEYSKVVQKARDKAFIEAQLCTLTAQGLVWMVAKRQEVTDKISLLYSW